MPESEGDSILNRKITRRRFLVTSGAGAAGYAARYFTERTGIGREDHNDTQSETVPQDIQSSEAVEVKSDLKPPENYNADAVSPHIEQKDELITGGFLSLYHAFKEMDEVYRAVPGFSNGSKDLDLYHQVLIPAANGINSEMLEEIRTNLGTKKELAVGDAISKIDRLTIEGNEDLDVIKQGFRKFAEVIPALVLASPDKIKLTHVGGYYAPEHEVATATAHNPENFYVTTFHELTHALEANWDQILPYFTEEQLVAYFETKVRLTKATADAYFNAAWEDAVSFKTGTPLFNVIEETPDELIEEAERVINEYDFLLNREPLTPIDQIRSEDPEFENRLPHNVPLKSWRYNRALHRVGKYALEFAQKPDDQRSEVERQFLQSNIARNTLRNAIEEFDHYFVGPVQLETGGLPNKEKDAVYFGSEITTANLEIQNSKLKAFSTLPPEEQTVEGLRNALWTPLHTGMEEPPPTPVEIINDEGSVNSESISEILKRHELSEYNHALVRLVQLVDRYRTFPVYLNGSNEPMLQILHSAVMSNGHESLPELSQGWNPEGNNKAWLDADGKMRTIPIDTNHTGENSEQVRSRLVHAANQIPLFTLTLPDTISMGQEYYHSNEVLGLPQLHPDDPEKFITAFSQALCHGFESDWQKMKPYVSKEFHAYYVDKKLTEITTVADAYFSIPFEQALLFRDGGPLIGLAASREGVENSERHIRESYESEYDGEKLDDSNDFIASYPDGYTKETLRYERLVHYVGRRLYEISQKEPKDRTGLDNSFMHDNVVGGLVSHAINTIDYLLAEPVLTRSGRLPHSLHDDDMPNDSPLLHAQIRMQQARLAPYDHLPHDSLDPAGLWRYALGVN